ncbi:YceI family protein [Fodinibius sediminis]|uniref:YceI-like domain-containing protein n=1 Tax=Fodinibius sediminis TaxID=1214077 RepID=A0A521BI49_9BACT|nr:YceI family protein [Fodinibius sediminis]SMO46736.1 YceI-like domain-containing protein [Fodinibius sediminis]
MKSLLASIFLFLFTFSGNVLAQSTGYSLLEKSTMQVDGTSTIHDWTADAEEIDITNFNFDAAALSSDAENSPVTSLSLRVPVEKLESGKGRMNGKMYDALKKDDHPNITFELSSAELNGSSSGSTFTLNTSGTLTIAGVSKEINFPVEGSVVEDGTYKFTGSYELNMEDYDVDPPSAMFGTIKSGEMVTISFELFFSQQ